MRVSKVAIINLALVLCFLAFVEGGDVSSIITPSLFKEMLKHRNDPQCEAKGFYTYHAFITAANYFSKFGTTGDINVRKRELAAFFAQTSHETTGGWATAPDGPYAWGYCKKKENDRGNNFCDESTPAGAKWPCVPGRKYYGRGPMQISYNYNYGPAGRAINEDLLSHPGLVDKDPVISFKTAIWFWMTPQGPKPSCHDVITNNRLLTELLEELQDLVSSPTSSTGDWNVVRGTAPLKQRTRGTVGCLEWTLDRTWLAVTKGPSLKPCSLLQSRLWACRSSGGSKGLQDLVSSLISSIGATACAHLGLTLSLPA